jgi:alkyl hydroperoxide reductase subunit AhpF
MSDKRHVEIFSAGCAVCEAVVRRVRDMACPSCEIAVLDMNDAKVAERATAAGVRSVPAVMIDGRLVDCCAGRGPDEAVLRAAGLGRPRA